MLLTEILIAALATWQAVEVWHHSSLFAGWRARVELWEGFFGKMLTCPFCLAVWVSAVMLAPLEIPIVGVEHMPQGVVAGAVWCAFAYARFFVYTLAVARLANLGNDLTHKWCRTPRENRPDLKSGFEEKA